MKAPKKVYLFTENKSTGGIWSIVTPAKEGAYKYEYVLAGSERKRVIRELRKWLQKKISIVSEGGTAQTLPPGIFVPKEEYRQLQSELSRLRSIIEGLWCDRVNDTAIGSSCDRCQICKAKQRAKAKKGVRK